MAEATESKVEWFVECMNHDSNNRLAEALAAQGYGYDSEAKSEVVLCHDDKNRSFFRIPGSFVRRVIRAKKGSDVLAFRFWKRNHANAKAFPADFVERERGARTSPKYKSAADKLKAEKAARVTGTT